MAICVYLSHTYLVKSRYPKRANSLIDLKTAHLKISDRYNLVNDFEVKVQELPVLNRNF